MAGEQGTVQSGEFRSESPVKKKAAGDWRSRS